MGDYYTDDELEVIKQKARNEALLDREAQHERNKLDIDTIRHMSPEQIAARQEEVDAVLSDPDAWTEDREEPHLGEEPNGDDALMPDLPRSIRDLKRKMDSMGEEEGREWEKANRDHVDALLKAGK